MQGPDEQNARSPRVTVRVRGNGKDTRFAQMLLFFVAADVYSRSFCEFFSVANVNSFFITEPNEDITSFSNCVEQLSLAWQFVSIGSLTGVSLNTSNQDRGEKMICMTPDCAV